MHMIEKTLSLYCVKYAHSVLPKKAIFKGEASEEKLPITFCIYLIQTEDKNILVDAGCDSMPSFDMKAFYSPAFVLRQVGLSSDEITDVIITHAHHDHIEAVKHFRNATIHISEEAYLKGKKHIPNEMKTRLFKEEYAIHPLVRIIKWGGHAIGSAIVEIKGKEKTHVLAGDEIYTNDCIAQKIPTGSSYNEAQSIAFIEKYSDPKYCVHTCHDISLKTEKIKVL